MILCFFGKQDRNMKGDRKRHRDRQREREKERICQHKHTHTYIHIRTLITPFSADSGADRSPLSFILLFFKKKTKTRKAPASAAKAGKCSVCESMDASKENHRPRTAMSEKHSLPVSSELSYSNKKKTNCFITLLAFYIYFIC